MTSRFRNNGICLMLSDEELELLNKRYKASKYKTLRQFIMKCILEKDIYVLDMDVFHEISTDISRTSNNINQIAKRVNTTSIIYKEDVEDLKSLLENQTKDIFSMRKEIYSLTDSNNINTEKK